MLVLRIITVICLSVLLSCGVKYSDNKAIKLIEDENDASLAVESTPKVVTPVRVRKTAISAEVLFLLITAEIAGQRNQYGIALDGYLRAAKRVQDIEVIKRSAQIALFLKDDKRLSESLDLWQAFDKQNLELNSLRAVSALRLEDKDVAFNSLEFILINDADAFQGHVINIMKALTTQESRRLTYTILTMLSKKYADNADIYFLQALLETQQRHYAEAQTHLDKVLEYKPSWEKALLLQAQLYISQGDFSQAREFLQRAAEKTNDIKIQEQIAQLWIQENNYQQAAKVLEAQLEKPGKHNEMRFKLALVYLQLEQFDDARIIFEELLHQQAFHDRCAFYLGRLAAREKDFAKALVWFDSVGEGVYAFDAHYHAVLVLLSDSLESQALKRVGELKAKFPKKMSKIILLEADIYKQQGVEQSAFNVLTEGLLLEPDNIEILYARALVAETLGLLDVLEDDLRYIIEKQPNNANALNSLGYTLADKTDRYADAKVLLERAIALKPNEVTIIDSYGWLLFKMGRLEEALVYLQKAYDREPQAEISAHLIDVLWSLKRRDSARAILKKALELAPEDKLLLEVKTRLLGQ